MEDITAKSTGTPETKNNIQQEGNEGKYEEKEDKDQPIEPNMKKIFYTPKVRSNNYVPKRPIRPIIFDLYLCTKWYETSNGENGSNEEGIWSCLIIRQSQESINKKQTTFMLSGKEEKSNHVRIRLSAIIESIEWIIGSVEVHQRGLLEINIVCSDIFIVNLLRDWIRKWDKNEFNIENDPRPNKDLLVTLMAKIKDVKLEIRWQAEQTHELIPLINNIDNNINNANDTSNNKIDNMDQKNNEKNNGKDNGKDSENEKKISDVKII